jgi:hypothetical protein
MGTAYGIYPCGSALVMGKIDGETFLGRLLIFFFGGAGDGKRNSRARNAETMRRCFAGRCEFRTALCVCYILYVGQWKFRCNMSSGHREGGPRSSIALGRHVCCSTSTARRPSPHIEDGEGVVAPRSATDSTEQRV